MAAVLRSATRRMTALLQRPAPGALLQRPAPGALLQRQAAGSLLQRQAAGSLLQRPAPGALLQRQAAASLLQRPAPGALLQPAATSPGSPLSPAGRCLQAGGRSMSSSSSPPNTEAVLIRVEKAKANEMIKAEKNLELLRVDSDMRRHAVHASWAALSIVETPSDSVDFSTIPKTMKSLKDALKPTNVDIDHTAPFLCMVIGFIFMLLTHELADVTQQEKQLKSEWDKFMDFVTKYFD